MTAAQGQQLLLAKRLHRAYLRVLLPFASDDYFDTCLAGMSDEEAARWLAVAQEAQKWAGEL